MIYYRKTLTNVTSSGLKLLWDLTLQLPDSVGIAFQSKAHQTSPLVQKECSKEFQDDNSLTKKIIDDAQKHFSEIDSDGISEK